MVKFNIKDRFSKEKRQARLEARLQKQLAKEQSKYTRYASLSEEQKRIKKLQNEIQSYRQMRGVKKRNVKIGGHTFSI